MRRFVAAVAVGVAALGAAGPAGALETATFGFDHSRGPSGRLDVEIKAGRTTTAELQVWNKGDGVLTLDLSAVPASVDDTGQAALGGDDTALGWVDFADERVDLAPGERRTVELRVRAPRKLTDEVRTLAVVAQPAVADGSAPAVVERLALMAYLRPAEGSLIASLGPFPWIAAALLAAVGGGLLRSRYRPSRG